MDNFKDIDKVIKKAKKQVKFHKSQNRDVLNYESNPVTQIYKIFEKLNKRWFDDVNRWKSK